MADPITANPDEASPRKPARPFFNHIPSFQWVRQCWPKLVGILLASTLLAGLLLLVFVLVRQSPIIEYRATTAILEFTVDGPLETVWNLPARTWSTPKYTDDGLSRTWHRIGLGPLILPRGTSIQVVRLAGQPLRITITGTVKDNPPIMYDASSTNIELEKNSKIVVGGSEGNAAPAALSPEAPCNVRLLPMAFRGNGRVVIGTPFNLAAYDPPEQLALLKDEEFIDELVQPQMSAGQVSVYGRSLLTDELYKTDDISLETGDQLRLEDKRTGDTNKPGLFLISISGCEEISIRGAEITRDAIVTKIGGSATSMSLSMWQIMTTDRLIALLLSMAGAITAVVGAYSNIVQLSLAIRRKRQSKEV